MSTNFEQAAVDLKARLTNGDPLSDCMVFFDKHFSEVVGFLELGRLKQSPKIVDLVCSIVEKSFDAELELTYSKFFYIKPLCLYHGPCNFGNVMGNIFYFTDINQGVIGLDSGSDEQSIQFLELREAASEPASVE